MIGGLGGSGLLGLDDLGVSIQHLLNLTPRRVIAKLHCLEGLELLKLGVELSLLNYNLVPLSFFLAFFALLIEGRAAAVEVIVELSHVLV